MKTNYEIRYAAHPEDAKHYDTTRIRRDFLIERVFTPDEVNMVYSMYDRMVVGGAQPVGEVLRLEAIDPLKAPFFTTRREVGIFNVGGPGIVRAGDAVFELAAAIEGHPDNVAPAVYGGLTMSWDMETAEGVGSVPIPGGEPMHNGFHTINYRVADDLTAAVFVPDYELSTEKARQALPTEIPFKDAVHNVSRVSLLPAAMNPAMLASGSRQNANALLFAATQDRLHQPYRASLMEPSWALIEKMRSHGFASTVSGAGPCVLVLHHGDAHEELERIAAEELASGHWRVLHLAVDTKGVQVERA